MAKKFIPKEQKIDVENQEQELERKFEKEHKSTWFNKLLYHFKNKFIAENLDNMVIDYEPKNDYQATQFDINTYQFKGKDLSETQSYLIYESAYQNLYQKMKTIKRNNLSKENDKEVDKSLGSSELLQVTDNGQSDYFLDLFRIAQSAFMLSYNRFNSLVLKCRMSSVYFDNLIYKKLREYDMDDVREIVGYDDVPVMIEMMFFKDNSILFRVNIDDKDLSNKIYEYLLSHYDDFKKFIVEHNRLNDEMLMNYVDGEKTVEKDIFYEQNKQMLQDTNFSYVGIYEILLQDFKHGVVIDVNDLMYLSHFLTEIISVKLSRKDGKLSHQKSMRNDIKDFDELMKYVKSHLISNDVANLLKNKNNKK